MWLQLIPLKLLVDGPETDACGTSSSSRIVRPCLRLFAQRYGDSQELQFGIPRMGRQQSAAHIQSYKSDLTKRENVADVSGVPTAFSLGTSY